MVLLVGGSVRLLTVFAFAESGKARQILDEWRVYYNEYAWVTAEDRGAAIWISSSP